MKTTVRIPTPLRKITDDLSEIECEVETVGAAIDYLEQKYPGIKERLCDENGEPRRFINIYVGEEDIRFLDGLNTKIEADQEISIIPAIAGGSGL
jgi:molybdopterin synthase sulfur carrier subunit